MTRALRACRTQEPDGWHLSVQFEAAPKSYPAPTRGVTGADGGLAHLLTLSDGKKVEAPRVARKAEKRIRRLNRERDRRRKGSVNRKRTVAKLGHAHRQVRNRRQDYLHKTTRELVDTYAGFAVETLSLKGLARTRLAKSFADAALGEMLRQLAYKSRWAGREWRELSRFQRSTGVCPCCDTCGPKLPLSVREWACETCGAVHDRDVAAARVILSRAVGAACPEPAGPPGESEALPFVAGSGYLLGLATAGHLRMLPRSDLTKSNKSESNEITAIPDLLEVLDIKGGIVTLDAMGGAGQEGSDGVAVGRPA